MSPPGRQVKHVARFEDDVLFRLEMGQQLDRLAGLQRRIAHRAEPPAPTACGLKQEDVIGVLMRADAATIARPGNHQIVESGVGHEAEQLHQIAGGVEVEVDSLHQQRPVALFHRGQLLAGKRRVVELPETPTVLQQARLDVVPPRQREQLCPREQGTKTRESPSQQQGLALPVLAEKAGKIEIAPLNRRC
ncbi:hypothetical protein GALL_485250 [mine drainage metagenome]|uniref:Uncharacterized protein n=1 Tax=mine drainage metagenome TaxID=410659 RepID=A0A1J5PQL8_9ZZZZ